MEDGQIVRLYWERNQQAIVETQKKYGSYCRKIADNILNNGEDAEECVNDTYLNAWNAMPPERPRVLATYLGKLTRNLAFNRYRHDHAEKRGGGQLPLVLEEIGEFVSGRDSVEQEADMQELVCAINAFLGTLSPKKRSIFLCRYWYTDSVADIAARHGMSAGAVSVQLNRMRMKLHKYLVERGFEP